MTLQEKLAAAKTQLAAAQATLTDADKEEQAARAELEAIEAEMQAVAKAKRDLDLARRLDTAQETLGPTAVLKAVAIQCYPDTFILRRNGKAHAEWSEKVALAQAGNKKIDQAMAARQYAVACIYDWNGETSSLDGAKGVELSKFLQANPGVVTPLVNAAAELAGVFAEESKS
jgi:hypothetical protein